MMANQDDLAQLITAEQGKPLAEAQGRDRLRRVASSSGSPRKRKRVYGDTIPSPWADKRIVVHQAADRRRARAITPWNFPNAMITRKAGPGARRRLHRGDQAGRARRRSRRSRWPSSRERAGIPKGVLNVITGDATAIGGELCANPMVRKLSFTGSTEVGRMLMAQCADTIKKLSLELGGNAPFIVFDDADLDAAVEGAHRLEVPQRRPDLRVRQPHLRAGRRLRRVRREARREGEGASRSAPAPSRA